MCLSESIEGVTSPELKYGIRESKYKLNFSEFSVFETLGFKLVRIRGGDEKWYARVFDIGSHTFVSYTLASGVKYCT